MEKNAPSSAANARKMAASHKLARHRGCGVNIAAALPAPALGSGRWILSSRDRSGKNARINHFIVWSIGMGAAKSSDK
jgi:hypothetical protein